MSLRRLPSSLPFTLPGVLLASVAYDPGTPTDVNTSSSSAADIDSTNLAVTFTAPASGKVLIRFTGNLYMSTTNGTIRWGVREGSTTIGTLADVCQNNDNETAVSHAQVVTGLTPGSSHTYKWAWSVTLNTAHMRYGGIYGQAVMEVIGA